MQAFDEFMARLQQLMGEEAKSPYAWASRVGISTGTLQSVIQRRSIPKAKTLAEWASKVGCDPTWLITGEGEPFPHQQATPKSETAAGQRKAPSVAGTIAAGTSKVDTAKLELAMRALNEWEQERGVKVAEERRPAVIAILYDYLQRSDEDSPEALSVVFRALG